MFRLLAPACGRRADRVIAISQTARADLVATLRLLPEKVAVTPLGVAPPTVPPTPAPEMRARLGLAAGAPVVLSVAQLAVHKNLDALVDAAAALPARGIQLVVAGSPSAYGRDLLSRAAARGVRLVLPGFVSQADLEGLYALADAFVLPSLHEGFGLPVLEAMARGVPVACAAATALPEVAAGAALLFDPRDPRAVAQALARILDDEPLRDELRVRGRARAAAMPWEATARATLRTYREAIASAGLGQR
jgi:glycosyltransferase involved in cell wall biosynthesis